MNAPGDSEAGSWGVPAGKIEPNEIPLQGAARKLFEETSQINTLGGDLQGGGGSGLKLWLSREIARLHNGSLEYRPRINGTGSIFTLSLPCSLLSPR